MDEPEVCQIGARYLTGMIVYEIRQKVGDAESPAPVYHWPGQM
jgi:hypothetical protein